jgi:hypothetical protein
MDTDSRIFRREPDMVAPPQMEGTLTAMANDVNGAPDNAFDGVAKQLRRRNPLVAN